MTRRPSPPSITSRSNRFQRNFRSPSHSRTIRGSFIQTNTSPTPNHQFQFPQIQPPLMVLQSAVLPISSYPVTHYRLLMDPTRLPPVNPNMWLETGLTGIIVELFVDINGRPYPVRLMDPQFLARIAIEMIRRGSQNIAAIQLTKFQDLPPMEIAHQMAQNPFQTPLNFPSFVWGSHQPTNSENLFQMIPSIHMEPIYLHTMENYNQGNLAQLSRSPTPSNSAQVNEATEIMDVNATEILMEMDYLSISLWTGFVEDKERHLCWTFPTTLTFTTLHLKCYLPPTKYKYRAVAYPVLKEDQSMETSPGYNPKTVMRGKVLRKEIVRHSPSSMKIILWNCRGAGSISFHRTARNIVDTHMPTMLALVDTRLNEEGHYALLNTLPFDEICQVPAVGYAGGMVLLWRRNSFKVEITRCEEMEIHADIKVIGR